MTNFDKGIRSATRVVSGNTINAGLLRKAIVTDPWNGFTLCPNPSAANAEAYSALRAEITDKNALSSVKELATQAWWSQQSALTYDAHRDDRMITLLRQALQHHKNRLDNAATPQPTGPAMSDSYRAFLQTLAPAPSDAPKYLKHKYCDGCGQRVMVSIPIGYQTFDFHCPNCGYSVTTNVD